MFFTWLSGLLTANDVYASSDESLKDNIQTLPNALETVSQLRGVSFNWKENGKPSIGVIAQEIEKILPMVVNETDGIKSVSYGNIVGLLIEAIKQQEQEILNLKDRVTQLESK